MSVPTVSDVNATPFRKVSGNGANRTVVDGELLSTHKPVIKAGVPRLIPNEFTGLPVRKTSAGKIIGGKPINNFK